MAFSGKTHTSPIGGWDQTKGGKRTSRIDVEWRPKHVTKNLAAAGSLLSGRTVVTSLDFEEAMVRDAVYYIDPPYYHAGKQMYPIYMTPADHIRLAETLAKMDRWVLSYDNCEEVLELYKRHEITEATWIYSTSGDGKRKLGTELIITPRRKGRYKR